MATSHRWWIWAVMGAGWLASPVIGQEDPPAPERHPGLVKLNEILERRASSEEELFANIKEAVKLCQEVQADAKATESDVTTALSAELDLTYQGHAVGAEGFAEKVRELQKEIEKKTPESPLLAKATGYAFRVDNFDKEGAPKEGSLERAEKLLDKYPDQKRMGFEIMMELAESASRSDQTAVALATYKALLKRFPDTGLTEMVEGNVRRLEAIGKDFPIEGVLLTGEKLDPTALKGKVVVIDFWATWCGPCVAELPELKRVYEELHDKGFEVIGVSLDEERAELEAFVEEQKLPWPQLYPPKGEPSGSETPLAVKYGITGIPTVFLIGRDGKLVSTSLRGPALEAQVRKLIGEKS